MHPIGYRFFLEAKCLVAGVGRVKPEVTYLKSCVLLDRTLKLYAARFPSAGGLQKDAGICSLDPHQTADRRPYLKGAPIKYTERIAKKCFKFPHLREDAPVQHVVQWCVQALHLAFNDPTVSEEDGPLWQSLLLHTQNDSGKVLSCCTEVAVVHRCQMPTFLMSSELSCKKLAVEGLSEASSYCLSYITGADGTRLVPCFVKYFVFMQWMLGLPASRMAVVIQVPFDTGHEDTEGFGQTVFRFDKGDFGKVKPQLIPVTDIVRPLILIKTPSGSRDKCMWRLVQYQGKLLGTFDESDYWE